MKKANPIEMVDFLGNYLMETKCRQELIEILTDQLDYNKTTAISRLKQQIFPLCKTR